MVRAASDVVKIEAKYARNEKLKMEFYHA